MVIVGGVEGEALVCSVAVSGMQVSLDSGLSLATAVQAKCIVYTLLSRTILCYAIEPYY